MYTSSSTPCSLSPPHLYSLPHLYPPTSLYPPPPTHTRPQIAKYSLLCAAHRIAAAKRKRNDPDEDEGKEASLAAAVARTVVQQVSEVGDDRYVGWVYVCV